MDLGAAVEKLGRGLVVDAVFYNDQARGVAGGADSSFGVARSTLNAARRTIIAGTEWSGFDNFTGNFLSHLATLNDNYCSRITMLNQVKSSRPKWHGWFMLCSG